MRRAVSIRLIFAAACCIGACSSFTSATSPPPQDAGDGDADTRDAELEAAPDGDAATDVTNDVAVDASACPGKNLANDPLNCGACARKCQPASCIAGECEHLVFVTQVDQPALLGGLDGADALCTSTAVSSGISQAPFKAWLSATGIDAAGRLQHGARRYKDRLEMTVAANWTVLVSGALERAIRWSDFGNDVSGKHVRTGTATTGVFAGPSDCDGWGASSGKLDTFGIVGDADGGWTAAGVETCLTSSALYCVEQ
jgi:hypothetical protein